MSAAPHDVGVAAAERDPLGVEVLEQCLRELARGGQLVAHLGQGDRATVALRGGQDALPRLAQRVGVVVERLRDADDPSGAAQRGQVAGVKL